MTVDDLVRRLRIAAGSPAAEMTFDAWRENFCAAADPFETAVAAGLDGGQLAYCFAGAYQAALRRLLPDLPPRAFAALLLSEGRNQRPESLDTVLTPLDDGRFRLDGEKSFVTGAQAADPLLVVAREGEVVAGRAAAVLLRVARDTPGVTITPRDDLPLLAALPHGRASFTQVILDAGAILPGDGWRDHARPFRTIEDVHVLAAVAAHAAVQVLRRDLPAALLATLVGCIARLAGCASAAPTDPAAHLLFAAAEQELQQAALRLSEILSREDDFIARDWRANQALVMLAAPARAKRLEQALAKLSLR